MVSAKISLAAITLTSAALSVNAMKIKGDSPAAQAVTQKYQFKPTARPGTRPTGLDTPRIGHGKTPRASGKGAFPAMRPSRTFSFSAARNGKVVKRSGTALHPGTGFENFKRVSEKHYRRALVEDILEELERRGLELDELDELE